MGKLRINRIRTDNFDFTAFCREYSILRLESTSKSYLYGAEILDTLKQEDSGVKSICYRGGSIFVLVSRKDEESVKRTCARLITTKDLKAPGPISSDAVRDQYQGIAVQLLINSLPGIGRLPDLKYVNLTGQMYCHHVDWETKKGVYVVLKILVKRDLSLVAEADTFSKKPPLYESKSKRPVFYALDGQGYMQRCFDFGRKDLYLNRRFDNNRATIPFLNIQDEGAFLKSKMGVLSRIMKQYNEAYGNFHRLEFIEAEVGHRLTTTKTEFQKMIKNPRDGWVKSHGIILEDAIANESSEAQMTRIREYIESEYGKVLKTADSGPKLRLIHDKQWHDDHKVDDQHVISSDDGVQQITYEKISEAKNIKPIINNCINNLIIKDDLTKGRLSIGKVDLDMNMVFGVQAQIPDDKSGRKQYLFLTIAPDGELCAERREVNPFGYDSSERLINLMMEMPEDKSKEFRGVIQYGDSIATLFDTSMFTVSENDIIQGQMRKNAGSGRVSLVERTEENREVALVAVTDINRFTFEGSDDVFYNVGVIGGGMQTVVQDASLIRRIHTEAGEDFSQILIPMMCEGHVRNEQLTVVPFPFKYLNEFAKMNNLEIV